MSDVTPNTPETPTKCPPNDNNRFQVLELIFAKLIKFGRSTSLVLMSCGQDECKFGRSTTRSASRSTPTHPKNNNCNASWDIYYGMYLTAILDSSRKGGNFFLFLNNYGSKQSVSIVEWCQMWPPTPLKHPQNALQMTTTDFKY